mmetsp:Transcript_89181/g.252738  ORF Transcript_89181/g.252738 Transcript_89181/m.252738 type:complete len:408 (+) Transcript_89181:838-2061(+)
MSRMATYRNMKVVKQFMNSGNKYRLMARIESALLPMKGLPSSSRPRQGRMARRMVENAIATSPRVPSGDFFSACSTTLIRCLKNSRSEITSVPDTCVPGQPPSSIEGPRSRWRSRPAGMELPCCDRRTSATSQRVVLPCSACMALVLSAVVGCRKTSCGSSSAKPTVVKRLQSICSSAIFGLTSSHEPISVRPVSRELSQPTAFIWFQTARGMKPYLMATVTHLSTVVRYSTTTSSTVVCSGRSPRMMPAEASIIAAVIKVRAMALSSKPPKPEPSRRLGGHMPRFLSASIEQPYSSRFKGTARGPSVCQSVCPMSSMKKTSQSNSSATLQAQLTRASLARGRTLGSLSRCCLPFAELDFVSALTSSDSSCEESRAGTCSCLVEALPEALPEAGALDSPADEAPATC